MLEEIFARRCGPMNARRLALLADCREGPDRPPLLEQILEAYLRPSLIWPEDPEGAHNFLRLRSALAHEDDGLNRELIARHFNHVSRKFIEALVSALPDTPLEDIYWRVHFLHAAQYYTLLNPDRIRYLSNDVCDPSDVETSLRYMVSFFAAAFRLHADSLASAGWAFNDRKSSI